MASLTAVARIQGTSSVSAGKSALEFALTDLKSVKAFLGFTSGFNDKDEILTEFIVNASQIIEKHTDRRLKKRIYVNDSSAVDIDGSGTEIIFLNEWPIISIQKINLGFGSGDLVPSDFQIYSHSGYIRLKERLAFTLQPQDFLREVPFGVGNIRVDFTAGFDPVPGDLKHATNMLVAHLWLNSPASGDRRMGLKSRGVRDQTESFIDDAAIPQRVIQLLETYVRRGFKSHRDTSVVSPI